ncbi:MAG TPA: PaaI family thioesterase [Syntrophales bacterium]|jgi:acyl-CoA thioesterase|nr:PaaI family thioesterase [Syntrophales bacterium]HRT61827.1 PaaI family thioesterase [Syntrophales bacterium]
MKKDSLRYARDIVAADPMATFLGIRLKELRRAYACLSLDIRPEYLNSLGRAHGMALSALVDQAAAVAANSTASPALIAEIKVHFLDAVHPGDTVTAEAKAIDIKNTLSLWQVDVRDSSGKLVAAGQALGYHRPPEE